MRSLQTATYLGRLYLGSRLRVALGSRQGLGTCVLDTVLVSRQGLGTTVLDIVLTCRQGLGTVVVVVVVHLAVAIRVILVQFLCFGDHFHLASFDFCRRLFLRKRP